MIDRRTRRCLEEAQAKLDQIEPNSRTGAVVIATFRAWLEEVWAPHHALLEEHLRDDLPGIKKELERQSKALFGDDERDGLMDLKRQICVAARWGTFLASVLAAFMIWVLNVLEKVIHLLQP